MDKNVINAVQKAGPHYVCKSAFFHYISKRIPSLMFYCFIQYQLFMFKKVMYFYKHVYPEARTFRQYASLPDP